MMTSLTMLSNWLQIIFHRSLQYEPSLFLGTPLMQLSINRSMFVLEVNFLMDDDIHINSDVVMLVV